VLLISLAVASLVYGPVLLFAKKYGVYDNPEARKLQRIPIPVMGGFVVFLGGIVGSLCYWYFRDCTSIIAVQVAMLILLLVGAYDDRNDLSPYQKFAVEIAVIIGLVLVNGYSINNFHGLWGIYELSPWVSWPLTVVACVGIINAINMIDGVDGLSSGICILILTAFSWMFFVAHDFVHSALCLCLVGGLIPFFIMNVFGNRSKMFIGDAGTMMLGVAICDMVLSMLSTDSLCLKRLAGTDYCLPAFVLAVLAVPVFDTLRVMIGRMMRHRSPFRPDRSHLHHAFIAYGFRHLETSLLEISLNGLIILVWFVLAHSFLPKDGQMYGVLLISITSIYGLFWMLGRKRRIAKQLEKGNQGVSQDGVK